MLYKTVHSINKYFQNEICSLKVIPRYLYKAEDKDDDYFDYHHRKRDAAAE